MIFSDLLDRPFRKTANGQVVNDLPLGRSVEEALRMVDALQFFEENGEVCPADWHKGDEGMKESAQGVAEYLSKH